MKSIFTTFLLLCSFIGLSVFFAVAEESASYNPALVTAYGQPLVTVKDLIYAASQLEKEQPGLRQIIPLMPKNDQLAFYEQLVTKLCNQKIAYNQLKKRGLDTNEHFKEELKKRLSGFSPETLQSNPLLLTSIEESIALEEFKRHVLAEVALPEKDAEAFYTRKVKTLPEFHRTPFISVLDGIKTFVVRVDDQFEAQYLLEKAVKSNIKQAAAEMHKEVMDLGVLSQFAKSVDPALLQKGEDMEAIPKESFPVWDIVQSADKRFFYVVLGLMKTEPEYAHYSQVKDAAKEVINELHFVPKYEDELKRLYTEMKIEFNKKVLQQLTEQK